MPYYSDDTICAISSAAGAGARGIVRLSGPSVVTVAFTLFVADACDERFRGPEPSVLSGRMNIELDGRACELPSDLFIWPTNRSYTREPVAEFHTIGSASVLKAVLAELCRAGARLAEPGEFTLRAFLSGRVDLTQAEAVLGVIDAGGSKELDSALAQLAGGVAKPLHQLRKELLQLLAELEAGLDFVEEDIRFISSEAVLTRLNAARIHLQAVAQQMSSRASARELPQVALIGPPNAGKSSLFNAIVERYGEGNSLATRSAAPALVSARRGTTRDYLTARILLGDLACELVDTAGVESNGDRSDEPIEVAAQSLAREAKDRATIRVYCRDATDWRGGSAFQADELSSASYDLLVLTKSDLVERELPGDIDAPASTGCPPPIATSSVTGHGLESFCDAARAAILRDTVRQPASVVATTRERCHESVRLATSAIQVAEDLTATGAGDELVAAELRVALSELGKVVGAVYTDDLLERIFKTFCIGK